MCDIVKEVEDKCDSPKLADSIKTSAFISTASYVSLHAWESPALLYLFCKLDNTL